MIHNASPDRTGTLTHLVEAALAGSDPAFLCLVQQCEPRVRALLRRQLPDAVEVDDLFQEVVIRAMGSLPRLRDPGRFSGWILRIAFHASVDWIRRRRTQRVEALIHDPIDPISLRGADDGGGHDPERCLPRLVDAIATLHPQQATILLLRGLEGMAYRDIAGRLSISLAHVKSCLFRARHNLRNRVADAAMDRYLS